MVQTTQQAQPPHAKKVKVFVESVDGDNRQTVEFALENATELEHIVAIQSVFKIMGVDASISDMLSDYVKIGKAYEEVTASQNTPDPIVSLTPSTRILELKYNTDIQKRTVPREQSTDILSDTYNKANDINSSNKSDSNNLSAMAMAFADAGLSISSNSNTQEQSDTVTEDADKPAHFITGIKQTPSGDMYQCRLHCSACNHRKTLYIRPSSRQVYCHSCNKSHQVRPAKKSGHLIKDSMNNFFIAGSFVGEDE